jgi:hypothetical protein
MTGSDQSEKTTFYQDTVLAFSLALIAALLIKIPALWDIQLDNNEVFYSRNLSLFVLPVLTLYFAWIRQLKLQTVVGLALAFVAAAVLANIYPFTAGSDTQSLLALHLPVALWLLVGIAYSGGQWNQLEKRMDFIRFSGELFIYYILIALGGGVLTGIMALIFGTIGIDIEPFFEAWLLPCGAAGGVIIAAWLVENSNGMNQKLAPILARLFSPLFTIILITFLVTVIWTGSGIDIDRDVLIAFDMLLLIVLGLLLYGISARDATAPRSPFDVVQLALVIAALFADAIALWAISARITEMGFSPNRVAALGMNIILIGNLLWSAVLYIRFLRPGYSLLALNQWQTRYLTVYAVWAAIVAVLFPLLFGFA